jgi:regulator of cell morphogenesis and NO signaling
MNEQLAAAMVGDIVARDFRAAGVFERFGIDFCCGRRRPLFEACRIAAADGEAVARELEALPAIDPPDDDAANWPLDRLIDHIQDRHHRYVRAAMPRIARLLDKLLAVHGRRQLELPLVAAAFEQLAGDLEQHLVKEERVENNVLFPQAIALEAGPCHHDRG